ncbi:hypothetical protein [Burkholderia cenocepacia]|uniref:hypothetical protein n=1 Tax=Burkholderia cenocepacia TaxID=95486 RepID=UPI002857B5F2|nr:hypothetical protein [Burkholderia cenocepacia]MDR5660974.1 hypothetical protein [Burkholderia cenocepacia]MDR8094132.1 hypothetical protein [Burkholderia cenocepacia]
MHTLPSPHEDYEIRELRIEPFSEEWLTTSNIEAAHAMLKLHPADEMEAEAVLTRNDARGIEND